MHNSRGSDFSDGMTLLDRDNQPLVFAVFAMLGLLDGPPSPNKIACNRYSLDISKLYLGGKHALQTFWQRFWAAVCPR
jgi:hypothetical protein